MMPRMERVELRHISLQLRSNFQTSFGQETDRECILIRVQSEGEEGWGECVAGGEPGYSYETVGTAWHVLEKYFMPAMFEDGTLSPESLRPTLRRFRGHPLARAGLEMALWDLQGRKLDKSFAALIGSSRSRIPVGVSIGIQKTPDRMLDQIASYLEQGYGRVKIKIAPGSDLDVVGAIRKRFPDLRLWVDANAAYTLEDESLFKRLDEYSLELIEQPLFEDDLIDHAVLQSRLSTNLCLDESIHHLRDASHALELGSCRVINIKPARVGGFMSALEIESYCRQKGIPVWCGGMLETGIGRAANLALASRPGFSMPGDISATDRYYKEDIAEPVFKLNEDGTIDVPQGPGLGISVNMSVLDAYTLREKVYSAGRV